MIFYAPINCPDNQFNSLKTTNALAANTIEAASDRPEIPGQTGERQMPSESHLKAADHHESAAKSHRAAAEHHGKNDHMKGHEHATEVQKHSKVARAATDEAHARSSSKK
jgi:hypothetical protein